MLVDARQREEMAGVLDCRVVDRNTAQHILLFATWWEKSIECLVPISPDRERTALRLDAVVLELRVGRRRQLAKEFLFATSHEQPITP